MLVATAAECFWLEIDTVHCSQNDTSVTFRDGTGAASAPQEGAKKCQGLQLPHKTAVFLMQQIRGLSFGGSPAGGGW